MPPIQMLEMSVVVVGQHHNPSILNPDFLRHNLIVPEDATVTGSPISTPAVSQVEYSSGIRIIADRDRVNFLEKTAGKAIADLTCPRIAEQYLYKLPLVRYSAVGINFTAYSSAVKNPEKMLSERVIREGPWKSFHDVSPSVEVKFSYKESTSRITAFSAKVEDILAPVNIRNVLMFYVNNHHDISEPNDSFRAAVAVIGEWEKNLKDFESLANQFIGG